jgi:U5 small nuclear ribonucleoprotein component
MLRDHVPSPVQNARNKVLHTYTGDLSSQIAKDMLACDPEGELMIQICKLYPSQDATTFDAFGRVLSGTIERHESVRVRLLHLEMYVIRRGVHTFFLDDSTVR